MLISKTDSIFWSFSKTSSKFDPSQKHHHNSIDLTFVINNSITVNYFFHYTFLSLIRYLQFVLYTWRQWLKILYSGIAFQILIEALSLTTGGLSTAGGCAKSCSGPRCRDTYYNLQHTRVKVWSWFGSLHWVLGFDFIGWIVVVTIWLFSRTSS